MVRPARASRASLFTRVWCARAAATAPESDPAVMVKRRPSGVVASYRLGAIGTTLSRRRVEVGYRALVLAALHQSEHPSHCGGVTFDLHDVNTADMSPAAPVFGYAVVS